MRLTPYERERLAELRAWQAEPPDLGTRLLARPGSAAAQAVQAMVPVSALRAVLERLSGVAARLTDQRSVLRRAGVASIEDLQQQSLEDCDRLADGEARRAMLMGGAGGMVFGVAGSVGLVADVPALLTLALRTIQRLGLCYGESPTPEQRRADAIGIFALASANSAEEKQAALAALRAQRALIDAAWRDGVERVAERELAKEAAVISLQALASRIGLQLGRRKAGSLVPVLGAAVGASVNAWYLRDVARIARYVYQERWLARRHGELPRRALRKR